MSRGDRYALVETDGGALMLDRKSGAIVELNATAATIWRLALAGESEASIAATLTERHGLDLETTTRDVRETLRSSFESMAPAPEVDLKYERRASEYVFALRGAVVFVVDDGGQRLVLETVPEGARLGFLLQAVAPKLLALRGQAVLHASAVALGGRAIAFSGSSGAGKTSTARALAQAGAQLVCEDKLAVKLRGGGVTVAALGERAIVDWVASTASALTSSGSASCAGLDRAVEGQPIPLVEIGFLDHLRRTSGALTARLLTKTETAGAVFRHAFYGSDADQDWLRHLRTAAEIGQSVRGFALTVPDGLDRLAEAAVELARTGSLAAAG
jgi:hypothetical protein